MTREENIISIVAESTEYGSDVIRRVDSLVDDLGLDSLDFVELIMKLEEEFGVHISDETAMKMQTVEDVIYWVVRILEERK